MRALIAAALLATTASAAAAECTPEDIAGSWEMIGSHNGAWNRCKLTVDADGAFDGSCKGTERPRRGGVPVVGFFDLDEACAFTGEWTIGTTQKIQGQLAPGAEIGAGIVRFGKKRLNLGLHFNLVRVEE